MATIEKSIEVKVPVHTAYNQWTQFEDFPQFMEGVEDVRQIDDTHLHWRARFGGKVEEWDAEIDDQEPDRRVSWHAISGAQNAGAVTFAPTDAGTTRVDLRLDYQPEGATEQIGSALGLASRRVEGDLQRFKEFIESRGQETGAWRGRVTGGQSASAPGAMGAGIADDRTGGQASQEFEADRPYNRMGARSTDSIDGTTADDIVEGSSDYPFAGRARRPLGEGDAQTSPEGVDRVVDANREPIDRPVDS